MGPPKEIRESEKVVDEKVTRRTEEYLDEVTGERRVRTVEYVEKLIERQVLYPLKTSHQRLKYIHVFRWRKKKGREKAQIITIATISKAHRIYSKIRIPCFFFFNLLYKIVNYSMPHLGKLIVSLIY